MDYCISQNISSEEINILKLFLNQPQTELYIDQVGEFALAVNIKNCVTQCYLTNATITQPDGDLYPKIEISKKLESQAALMKVISNQNLKK